MRKTIQQIAQQGERLRKAIAAEYEKNEVLMDGLYLESNIETIKKYRSLNERNQQLRRRDNFVQVTTQRYIANTTRNNGYGWNIGRAEAHMIAGTLEQRITDK